MTSGAFQIEQLVCEIINSIEAYEYRPWSIGAQQFRVYLNGVNFFFGKKRRLRHEMNILIPQKYEQFFPEESLQLYIYWDIPLKCQKN